MLSRWIGPAVAAMACLGAGHAFAQDFASAAPSWPRGRAAPMLEDGLPPDAAVLAVDATVTRWFGLPSLETRSLAGMVPIRTVILAAGISQTGTPEVGWTALGFAIGAANPRGGVALRAIARRDRLTSFAFDGDARTAGGEVGVGAWAAAGARFRLHAQAPQVWREGAAPPLRRALALGVAWQGSGLSAWLTRRALPGTSGMRDGEHEAGVTLGGRVLSLWCAARDRPLRASLGVTAGLGAVRSGAAIDSHPVLDETSRLTVSLTRGSGP